jgi:predicted RNase H-like HicB family nuclease
LGGEAEVIWVKVTYHHEEGTWWAESDGVPGFSAAADSLDSLRALVREGMGFHLEGQEVDLREELAGGGAVVSYSYDVSDGGEMSLLNDSRSAPAISYRVVSTSGVVTGLGSLLVREAS